MKSPFRISLRLAVVLLAGVLLFNFFSYYSTRLRSREHEELVRFATLSSGQEALSQSITKDALILLNNDTDDKSSLVIHNKLKLNLDSLSRCHKFLVDNINFSGLSSNRNSEAVRVLLDNLDGPMARFSKIAGEISAADSEQIDLNGRRFTPELLLRERQLHPKLDLLTTKYNQIVDAKIEEAGDINTGKFISLIIA
ncbi:MAG: hypothetical protein EOO02_14475, partial [Chitinophagaceae bacterium]